jgi:hypothetical protein
MMLPSTNLQKVEEYWREEVFYPLAYDNDRVFHRDIVVILDFVSSAPTQGFEQRDNQLTYSLSLVKTQIRLSEPSLP